MDFSTEAIQLDASVSPETFGRFEIFEAESAEQKNQLYRFRYQIFVEEQYKFVNSADHQHRVLIDYLDEQAVHLCVAKKGEIIGSLRQIRGRDHATERMVKNLSLDLLERFPAKAFVFSGKLMLLPEYRGSSALLQLILANYASARLAGGQFDFIFCNPHLVRFYERIGYRRYRPYFHDADLGFQIPLVLVADDVEYLERIRSPLAKLASDQPNNPEHVAWFHEAFPNCKIFIALPTMTPENFSALLSTKINRDHIPLLYGLNEAETQEFIYSSTHFRLDAGTPLIRRNDFGQELYLILDGVAEVRRQSSECGAQLVCTTLGRGDVFGEISVLIRKPRSADVFAVTALEVIFIDQVTLERFTKGRPAMAAKLLFNLCQILAEQLESTFDLLSVNNKLV